MPGQLSGLAKGKQEKLSQALKEVEDSLAGFGHDQLAFKTALPRDRSGAYVRPEAGMH